MADLGNRRYIASYPLKDDKGMTCCDRKICTHEFYEHQEVNIPWWACVEDDCEEHQEMKIRNQQWPRLPRSAILKAQECPCFRNGCFCNFSEKHLYRQELLIVGTPSSGQSPEVGESKCSVLVPAKFTMRFLHPAASRTSPET